MMGVVGVNKTGALASIDVLFVGPLPRAGKFFLWTLLHVWMEFHNSEGSIASMCMSSMHEGGWDFPSCPARLNPLGRCYKPLVIMGSCDFWSFHLV